MSNITAKLIGEGKKLYANTCAAFTNLYAASKKIIPHKAVRMEQKHDPQQKAEDAAPGMAIENVAPDPTEQSTDNKFKQWLYKQLWEPIDWSHILQLAALFVGTAVAYVYWRQLIEMSNQTRLFGEQADRAVIQHLGNTAATIRQLELLGQQVSATRLQAEAIAVQTRQDQRPWIRFDFGDPNIPHETVNWIVAVDQPLVTPVRFTNIGKTAALDVHSFIVVELVKNGSDPKIPKHFGSIAEAKRHGGHRTATVNLGSGVIYPGSHISDMVPRLEIVNQQIQPKRLSTDEKNDLIAKTVHMRVFGEVRYMDVFGIHHWTKFCKESLIDGQEASTSQCAAYGNVDRNK